MDLEANKRRVWDCLTAFPHPDDAVFERLVHPDLVNHPAPPPMAASDA